MLTKSKIDKWVLIIFAVWVLACVAMMSYGPLPCSHNEQKLPNPGVEKTVSATPFTDKQLASWYASYNERYFSGHLPKNTTVTWTFLEDRYGETEPPTNGRFIILLDIPRNRESIMAQITLLHEMCHIATFEKGFDHGPAWQAEIHRLMMEGAFDDLI